MTLLRDLVLATGNRDKIVELAHALHHLPLRLIPVGELGAWPDPDETGATLAENALIKARVAMERTGRAVLADDTGLEVDALGGAPGVFSSRYAGPGATYAQNTARLLRDLASVPEEARTARFRCVIALLDPDGRTATVDGVVEGRILLSPRGTGGFGYDPVFLAPEFGRTFAELTVAEKETISHRGRALARARETLASWYGLA